VTTYDDDEVGRTSQLHGRRLWSMCEVPVVKGAGLQRSRLYRVRNMKELCFMRTTADREDLR
jgi:hypothetical protein